MFLKTHTRDLLAEYPIPPSFATFEWASLIHVQGNIVNHSPERKCLYSHIDKIIDYEALLIAKFRVCL